MNKSKTKTSISDHWNIYWPAYTCLSVFVVGSIIVGLLGYSIISHKDGSMNESVKEPVAIKVFINENDTIIPALSSEIKELREMIQEMQEDTLCVTITQRK